MEDDDVVGGADLELEAAGLAGVVEVEIIDAGELES